MAQIRIGLRRRAPLEPDEFDAIRRLALSRETNRWPGLEDLRIRALDGFELWRASVQIRRTSPDPDMRGFPLFAETLRDLWELVPGSELVIDDPTRLLSLVGNQLVLGGRDTATTHRLLHPWPPEEAILSSIADGCDPIEFEPSKPEPTGHVDMIGELEAIGAQLLQAVNHLERSQGLQPDAIESLEELFLTDRKETIPVEHLDQAIDLMFPDRVPPILNDFRHQSGYGRFVLAQLGGRPRAATATTLLLSKGIWDCRSVPGLLDTLFAIALEETHPWPLRALSVRAIETSSRPDSPALLRELAKSSAVPVARAALRALGRVEDGESRSLLRSMARIPALSAHAIAAMAEYGDPQGCAIASDLARDPRDEVRLAIAHHLPRLGGARSIPVLEGLIRDHAPAVRIEAIASLAEVCDSSRLDTLRERSETDEIIAILHGLERSDRVAEARLIVDTLTDLRKEVREAALEALASLAIPSTTGPILNCLHDPDTDVVLAAIEALSACGDERARRPLESLAMQEGPIGTSAFHARENIAYGDSPPPDGRIRVWGRLPKNSKDSVRVLVEQQIRPPFESIEFDSHDFRASIEISPLELRTYGRIIDSLQELDLVLPGLLWNVTDDQGLMRRGPEGWILSSSRGQRVRELGETSNKVPIPSAASENTLLTVPPPSRLSIALPPPENEEDAPTDTMTEAPPIREKPSVAIAVDAWEDTEESLSEEPPPANGIVLTIGATTSIADPIANIIEVQAAPEQADPDPGFVEEVLDSQPNAAFVYISPRGAEANDTFEIHHPPSSHIQAYTHHAPMDDQVDVFEFEPGQYSSVPISPDEPED